MSALFSFAPASSGGGGGDIPDIIKVSVENRAINRMDYDGTSSVPVEITDKFKAIFDLENLETGWAKFTATGPTFLFARIGETVPAQPADLDADGKPAFKPGFRVRIKLAKECGGDVREFASNSRYLRDSLSELHDAYLAGRDGSKLPVVRLKEWKKETTTSTKYPSKTFFRPIWEIVQWADRPADLQPRGASKPAAPNGSTPPATGSTKAEPPKAKQPVDELADDFG